jgi:hypothetical protein
MRLKMDCPDKPGNDEIFFLCHTRPACHGIAKSKDCHGIAKAKTGLSRHGKSEDGVFWFCHYPTCSGNPCFLKMDCPDKPGNDEIFFLPLPDLHATAKQKQRRACHDVAKARTGFFVLSLPDLIG